MRIIECQQGSAQWLQSRIGRITASRVSECLSKYARGKEGETAARRDYRVDLIVERLTGRSTENFNSPEMLWGVEHEDEAIFAYEDLTDVMAHKVGFILHPEWDWTGASPDSLIGQDGGVEIKCPKSATHWGWRMAGIVPPEHEPQLVWNMVCSGREWWDFASYDPRLPQKVRLFTKRLYRNEERILQVAEQVLRMHADVERDIEKEGLPPTKFEMPSPAARESAPPVEEWAARFDAMTSDEGMTA